MANIESELNAELIEKVLLDAYNAPVTAEFLTTGGGLTKVVSCQKVNEGSKLTLRSTGAGVECVLDIKDSNGLRVARIERHNYDNFQSVSLARGNAAWHSVLVDPSGSVEIESQNDVEVDNYVPLLLWEANMFIPVTNNSVIQYFQKSTNADIKSII